MKKTLTFLAALTVLVLGCSKSSTTTPMVYTVNGLSDITISQYVDTTFYVTTNTLYTSGPQEVATLTISDLPAGVTVSPTTISGTPQFGTVFTFHADATASGTFPVTLTASSASSGSKKYKFNIIVGAVSPLVYSLGAFPDITIPQYTNTITPIPVTATYTSGHQELVTLTPTTLPTGVTMDSATISGIPTFSSGFQMHTAFNTPGTYPVTITASSASTASVAHIFNVIVTASSDCATEVPDGTYNTNTTCTSYSGSGVGVSTATISNHGANMLSLGTPQFGINVYATLDCSTGTLSVTGGSHNVDLAVSPGGTGTFGPNTATVTYTITGAVNTTCTTTYTK